MRSTRFAVRGLAVAAALVLGLAACDDDEVVPPPQVTVSVAPQTHSMNVGETVTLSAAVSGTTNQSVTWESNNTGVATVNSSGVVTAVAPGTAVIIATSVAEPTAKGQATITVNPPPQVTVTVTPSQFDLAVGGTRQLVAQVSGTTNQSVTWSSDDPQVASVSNTGLVTGVSDGTTIIRATSVANPQAVGTAAVTVSRITGEIVIQRITAGNTNVPVNPNAIVGQIDVTVEFSAPQGSGVTGVKVLVDDQEICSQSVSDASLGDEAGALATMVCPIITNAFNPETGEPAFLNGQYTIGAQLVTSAGAVNAQANQTVTFANVDTWVLSVTTDGNEAFDNGGLLWHSGNVTVTGLPVLYSGRQVERASFTIAGVTRTDTDGSDGFSVTFPNSAAQPNNVAGVNTGPAGSNPTVNGAVYVGGQPAPTTVGAWTVNGNAGAPLRLDNQIPVVGTLVLPDQTATRACCSNNWVGPDYVFDNQNASAGHSDAGVGVVEVTIYAARATASNNSANAVVSGGEVVETGADLAPSTLNTEYRIAKRVCDALNNCANVLLSGNGSLNPGTTIGVDHQAPNFAYHNNSVADKAIFNNATGAPAANFQTVGTDDVSGFAGTPVVRRVYRNFITNQQTQCIAGNFAQNTCNATLDDFVEAVPVNDGYYTHEAFVRDQAGNVGPSLTRTVLVDLAAPTLAGNITIPTTLTGGALTTFRAAVRDNVDLEAIQLGIEFANGLSLVMGPWKVVGDGFGGNLVTEVTNQPLEVHFIRSIELTDGANSPDGIMHAAQAVFLRALDVAGNYGISPQPALFAAGSVPPGQRAWEYAPNLMTFSVAADAGTICDIEIDGNCGNTPQSTTISAIATGPTGTFANPYARVWFYREDKNTGRQEFIGEATAVDSQDNGTTRTYRYRITLNAAGLGAQSFMEFFAVALTQDGDALVSQIEHINVVD